MKATSNVLASLLFLTACGNVMQPGEPTNDDPPGDSGMNTVDGMDQGDDGGPVTPPPPELPFVTETPHAAASPTSLFSLSFANAELRTVVTSVTAAPRYDILEQRIVATSNDPIDVSIAISTPTGMFSRTIATDVIKNGQYPIGQDTLCAANNILLDAPPCERSAPAKRATTTTGAISQGRWRVQLVDETTGNAVSCVAASTYDLRCVVPAGSSGKPFRIVMSADGFTNLWDGATGPDELTLDAKRFTGTLGAIEFQCDRYEPNNNNNTEHCLAHWVFTRFTAIDAAALSFDPMTVTISAAGATKQFASPALTWDAGNDDLPGAAY